MATVSRQHTENMADRTSRLAPIMLVLALLALPGFSGAVEVGETAPDLALPRLQGSDSVALADYRGKIVYLDFWASWCPPCLVSMPIMNDLRNRLQAEGLAFEVVAINVDSDPEDGIDFLLDKPVDFVVLSDPEGTTPATYAVRGMPTSYLITADGEVAFRHEGFKRSDGDMIEQEIRRLITE